MYDEKEKIGGSSLCVKEDRTIQEQGVANRPNYEKNKERKRDLPCMSSWMACVRDGMETRERYRAWG